jgi:hypothetical protein
MWPDSFAKRKPTSLGGTPANKFSTIVSLSAIASFVVVLNALSYTPYLKKKIENLSQAVLKGEEERKVKAFLSDPLVKGAIHRKKKEYEEDPEPFGWF